MVLVNSFSHLLQSLSPGMTRPTFRNFTTLITGWVFTSRRTVTGMLVAAGIAGKIHHSRFHRVFSTARWSLDELGLRFFGQMQRLLPSGTVSLAGDDTLARKTGSKVFGAGMHHDPACSSRQMAVVNWGHNWVVLGVLVRFKFSGNRVFCLPILFRLYLNRKSSEKARRKHRTRPELMVEMLVKLCKRHPQRHFHFYADTAYGGKSVLNALPQNCGMTSRLLQNACLYEPAPPRDAHTMGRPRRRGAKLPNPGQMIEHQRAHRLTLDVYGRRREQRVVSVVARLHAAPERPVKVVVTESLNGLRYRQAFYTTEVERSDEEVLAGYGMRWAIEVSFHDAKQSLGFEQPQGWSRRAVKRTAPVAMLLYSLIVVWFSEGGGDAYKPVCRPWYTGKTGPSFADMLRTLRSQSIREELLQTPLSGQGSRKVMQIIDAALRAAA